MPNFPSKFQLINKINDRITGFQQLIERVLEISLSDRSIQNNILKNFEFKKKSLIKLKIVRVDQKAVKITLYLKY